MIAAKALILVLAGLSGQSAAEEGAIGGVVVNGADQTPVGQAEVVLRVRLDGQFAPFRETTTDAAGKFLFQPLPVGGEFLYLPGANRDGVHYPGSRIRLTPDRPYAGVKLVVYDAVKEPSPLVARRHEIVIVPEPGALKVTESILVDNPTLQSYVGRSDQEGGEPVTLRLAIPSDFERTTFHEEFFGRRFSLAGDRVVTGIPWQPGRRELKFTYVLPNQRQARLWRRPLDLPCDEVQVRVRTEKPEEVSSNLPSRPLRQPGEVVFQSTGETLPAGHVIRVELGHLPVPLMSYGRWLAPVALVGLIAASSLLAVRRRRRTKSQAAGLNRPSQSNRSGRSTRRASRGSKRRSRST